MERRWIPSPGHSWRGDGPEARVSRSRGGSESGEKVAQAPHPLPRPPASSRRSGRPRCFLAMKTDTARCQASAPVDGSSAPLGQLGASAVLPGLPGHGQQGCVPAPPMHLRGSPLKHPGLESPLWYPKPQACPEHGDTETPSREAQACSATSEQREQPPNPQQQHNGFGPGPGPHGCRRITGSSPERQHLSKTLLKR